MSLIAEPDWADALCRDTDPELFFPTAGNPANPAKAVCERCPLQVECLDYAMARREQFGVWGGLSAKERIAIWRKEERAQTRTTKPVTDRRVAKIAELTDAGWSAGKIAAHLNITDRSVHRLRRRAEASC